MKSGLFATPLEKYLPKAHVPLDAGFSALSRVWNDLYALQFSEILALETFRHAERVPSSLLDELGYKYAADFQGDDTDAQKRIKVFNAIKSHKKRGLWEDNIKLIIDAITGLSSSIAVFTNQNDMVWVGNQSDTTPHMTWGAPPDGGMAWYGGGFDPLRSGVIMIDLGGGASSLTEAKIDEVKTELLKEQFAYFELYLGYMDGDLFVLYGNGLVE